MGRAQPRREGSQTPAPRSDLAGWMSQLSDCLCWVGGGEHSRKSDIQTEPDYLSLVESLSQLSGRLCWAGEMDCQHYIG